MALSVHEIAAKCGVSAMTVSRALDPARAGKVRPETRARILAFCQKHQFQPNFLARSLASGRTGTIGMIMPWIETVGISPTFGRFLSALSAELQVHGYTLALLPVKNADRDTIFKEVLRTFLSCQVDGFLSLATFIDPAAVSEIIEKQVPLVTFAMPSDCVQSVAGLHQVRIDESEATTQLLTHLRQVGEVASLVYEGSDRSRRYQRLSETCRHACFVVPFDRFSTYDNAACAMRMVQEHWNELRRYPAWLGQNDRFAYGAMLAIREHGLIPGRDIALAGFDDIEADFEQPFFTTVHPPYSRMAAACVQLLLAQLNREPVPCSEVVIPAELVIRGSTSEMIK